MREIYLNIFLKCFFACILFLTTLEAKATTTLSQSQIKNLNLVKKVAKTLPNNKGETFENTAMAVCLVETNCGLHKIGDLKKDHIDIKKASLGIMQVRLQTAKFVAKKRNLKDVLKLDDNQLVNKLLNDDEFNVKVAINYIIYLNNRTKNYFQTISRYNGGSKNYAYVSRVMKRLKFIKNLKNL